MKFRDREHRTLLHGYNRSVSESQNIQIQRELEKTIQDLKSTADSDERRALLRKMRRLIEDADRLAAESPNES